MEVSRVAQQEVSTYITDQASWNDIEKQTRRKELLHRKIQFLFGLSFKWRSPKTQQCSETNPLVHSSDHLNAVQNFSS